MGFIELFHRLDDYVAASLEEEYSDYHPTVMMTDEDAHLIIQQLLDKWAERSDSIQRWFVKLASENEILIDYSKEKYPGHDVSAIATTIYLNVIAHSFTRMFDHLTHRCDCFGTGGRTLH